MTSQYPRASHAPSVKWRFPSIHPAGRRFVVLAVVVTLMTFILLPVWIACVMIALTVWIAAFFRDPVRVCVTDPRYIIAPADGLITMMHAVVPPFELAGEGGLGIDPLIRVSIFMSVFDVHIQRAPIGGSIKRIVYIAGRFFNAELDKASEDNERQHFLIKRSDGLMVGFTQIAGLIARRIIALTKIGDFVAAGHRIGLIRFGSRVDIYLPVNAMPRVALGQRTIAGETILAEIDGNGAVQGMAQ